MSGCRGVGVLCVDSTGPRLSIATFNTSKKMEQQYEEVLHQNTLQKCRNFKSAVTTCELEKENPDTDSIMQRNL